jgi:hypothetical protein
MLSGGSKVPDADPKVSQLRSDAGNQPDSVGRVRAAYVG